MYVIISNLYEPQGGFYKFAETPKKNPYMVTFQDNEHIKLIDKWKYILNENSYFDPPKIYFINFESVGIVEITERLAELENQI